MIAKMTKMLEEGMLGELGNIKLRQIVLYFIGILPKSFCIDFFIMTLR